jgi:hypothetical protein
MVFEFEASGFDCIMHNIKKKLFFNPMVDLYVSQ